MKVTVENFQSLGNVEIEVSGLTVLVGRSNLGKSALVRAFESALFNRGGEDFIRHGETQTRVVLSDLPTAAGGVANITWLKGHNLNKFVVDGQVFSKVGEKAPLEIATAGYRRVFVGDKERSRGEEMTPQVADQFDPLFLLTKPGSFVNDVLSVVSRLGVLLNASGRCARDLKAQKALLTTRQKDLATLDAKVKALDPVVALHGRVQALRSQLAAAKAADALLIKVRDLLARRRALADLTQMELPPLSVVALDAVDTRLQQTSRARQLTAARVMAMPVATLTIPPPVTHDVPDATPLTEGRALLDRRPAAQRIVNFRLPKARAYDDQIAKLDGVLKIRDTVAQFRAEQAVATAAVYHGVQALNGMTGTVTEAETELARVLATLTVCPVCDRVMEGSPEVAV